jgi:deferrochelatase/peroxidase EfeB
MIPDAHIDEIAEDTAQRAHPRVREDVRGDCLACLYELASGFRGGSEVFDETGRGKCRQILHRWNREVYKPRARSASAAQLERSNPKPPFVRLPQRTELQKQRTERDLVIAACLAHRVQWRTIARALGVSLGQVGKVAERFAEPVAVTSQS